MGATEVLGLASSISLLAGWRMYLCVFATGLAMKLGWISAPQHFESLHVLTNNWVLGAAGTGAIAEFFADKVAWLDSLWDSVHTVIRPIGGALLAAAIVDQSDPTWQVFSLLLGGGATLLAHGAKAGSRAVVNASPEPFSNVAVSVGEDVATTGLTFLVLNHPLVAGTIAAFVGLLCLYLIMLARKILKRLFAVPEPKTDTPS